MNSNNDTDNRLEAHSERIQGNNSDNQTFIYAQLAYAKSKHSTQANRKQKAYKKRWINKGGNK